VAQSWNPLDRYHTTNWFECVDVPLALGGNLISIQAVDWAGNVAVTNFEYFLDFTGDTTPPSLRLVWPQSGSHVYGDRFNVQAWTDNDTAAVTLACYGTNGTVQTLKGVVERGGNVWVQNVPLAAGTNNFTLTATSAGGYSGGINFSVIQSDTAWSVTPLTQDDLKYGYAKVTGTIADSDATVTVNEIQGTNYGNGSWEADYVPLPPGGTVAVQATAQLFGGERLQTLLTYVRDPMSFTKTYAYKLDYSDVFEVAEDTVYATEIVHSDVQWARGVGGTKLDTVSYVYVDPPGVWSNQTVTVWPADNGYWPCLPGQQVINDYSNGVLFSSDTKTVGRSWVDRMEQSATGGVWVANGFPVPFSVSSSRDTGLFTGGQSARESRGIIDLIAPLTVESQLLPYMNEWDSLDGFSHFLQAASPPVSVPSQLIRVGTLGNLGNDGHLYTVQSSGSEIVITLTAPPTSYYGDLPLAQKFNLQILANGNTLDPYNVATNAQFCVGQYVQFSPSWTPGVPGYASTVAQWTLGGTFVNDTSQLGSWVDSYPPYPGHWDYYGSVNYKNNPAMLTNENTHAWWVSGGPDSPGSRYSATLSEKLTFSNGQKAELSSSGLFNMYRPSLANWTQFGQVIITNYSGIPGVTEVIRAGKPNGADAMAFTTKVISAYEGVATFTQVYDDQSYPTAYGSNVLDGAEMYPYQGPITVSTNAAGARNTIAFNDLPAEISDYFGTFVSLVIQFRDYVRFMPNSGGPNIYVTLGKVNWNVEAFAIKPYDDWVLLPGNPPSPSWGPSEEFPSWVSVGPGH
jgi:hypothetical protein